MIAQPVVVDDLPRIAVISLGGTISMSRVGDGLAPTISVDEMIKSAEKIASLCSAEGIDFARVPSVATQVQDIDRLARLIESLIAGGIEGVVVTQGTDTLEECAFLLDLMLDPPVPVVVTGAMRAPSQEGSDAAANLVSAVRVARSKEAVGCGVLVAMNSEIHAARFVRKLHTFNPDAFKSPCWGPLGVIVEDRVKIMLKPTARSPTFTLNGQVPDVRIVTVDFGATCDHLDLVISSRPRGIIVAAAGAGHVPPTWVKSLEQAAQSFPVILSSRIGVGGIGRTTYSYAGSETDLIERGLIPGGHLDPAKARLLLTLLLASGSDRDSISKAFCAF